MTITTESALGEGRFKSTYDAQRRLRGRTLLTAGVGLVTFGLIAGATAFLVWAGHYQPLKPEVGIVATQQSLSLPGSVMTRYDYLSAATGYKLIVDTPKAGQTFGLYEGVQNSGGFGVTVVGAGTELAPISSARSSLTNERVYVIPGGNQAYSVNYGTLGTPLKQFDLAKGTWVGLHLAEQIPTCATVPNNLSQYKLPAMSVVPLVKYHVTYRFLWFTHTVTLPLSNPVGIVNPPSCP
jgi:hypothetical protein